MRRGEVGAAVAPEAGTGRKRKMKAGRAACGLRKRAGLERSRGEDADTRN
jgi:hypothetical protein